MLDIQINVILLVLVLIVLVFIIVILTSLLYLIWLVIKSFELSFRDIGHNQPKNMQRSHNETETIRADNARTESKKSQNLGVSEPEQIAPKITIPKPSGFNNGSI